VGFLRKVGWERAIVVQEASFTEQGIRGVECGLLQMGMRAATQLA